MEITFRSLVKADIPLLVAAFAEANWPKPQETFDTYMQEQHAQKRIVWIALDKDRIAGYCTLVWESQYEPFRTHAIPEIVDLNVLPSGAGKAP